VFGIADLMNARRVGTSPNNELAECLSEGVIVRRYWKARRAVPGYSVVEFGQTSIDASANPFQNDPDLRLHGNLFACPVLRDLGERGGVRAGALQAKRHRSA